MKACIASVVCLLAAGEAVPEAWVDPIARLGATGVLGAALLLLIFKTLPRMATEFRETLNEICARHDAWEKVRHEDQQRLEQVLTDLERGK